MNRHPNAKPTSTHSSRSFQPSSTGGNLDPELQEWVRLVAARSGVSEELVIKGCKEKYGAQGVKKAKEALENHMGGQSLMPEQTTYSPSPLGAKPSPDEKVIEHKLSENLKIRIWGDNLARSHIFSFDFVNAAGKYIRTPPGVKIYAVSGRGVDGEVYSIERSLANADPYNHPGSLRNSHDGSRPADLNWETYVIAEGTRILITQPDGEDYSLNIPMRRREGGPVTVLPMPDFW